jgi:hypothetical protein
VETKDGKAEQGPLTSRRPLGFNDRQHCVRGRRVVIIPRHNAERADVLALVVARTRRMRRDYRGAPSVEVQVAARAAELRVPYGAGVIDATGAGQAAASASGREPRRLRSASGKLTGDGAEIGEF